MSHCRDLGWQRLTNGELVRSASESFDVLITIDKNMQYQTSLKQLSLTVVVFDARNNTLEELRKFIPSFLSAVDTYRSGTYSVIDGKNLPF